MAKVDGKYIVLNRRGYIYHSVDVDNEKLLKRKWKAEIIYIGLCVLRWSIGMFERGLHGIALVKRRRCWPT